MNASKHSMLFRNERASELESIARLLDKNFKGKIKTYPIYQAIKRMKDPTYIPTLKNRKPNDNCWGYEILDFVIPVETSKHVRPTGITSVELVLNMRMVADYKEWETLSDPMCDLNFNVLIRGIGKDVYYWGFHLDRHLDDQISTEPHPIYHIQYYNNPLNDPSFNWGSTLYLDTPRIMHYPMDFILGVGFLTSNYAPRVFNDLLNDGGFANIYRQYQERIWKPFTHSIADHWNFTKSDIVWRPTSTLCPYLI
jgi:hypothetical protein